jgi:hypothetical protein
MLPESSLPVFVVYDTGLTTDIAISLLPIFEIQRKIPFDFDINFRFFYLVVYWPCMSCSFA